MFVCLFVCFFIRRQLVIVRDGAKRWPALLRGRGGVEIVAMTSAAYRDLFFGLFLRFLFGPFPVFSTSASSLLLRQLSSFVCVFLFSFTRAFR